MVAIASFLILALSAIPAITEAAHIGGHSLHHRAAAIQARASRACRDTKVPAPVKQLSKGKDDDNKDGAGSGSTSVKSSTKTASSSDSKPTDKGTPVGEPDLPPSTGGGSKLFPLNVKSSLQSFSTSPASGKPLPLTESTFHPSHMSHMSTLHWNKDTIQAVLPKGGYSPGHSPKDAGFSFYAHTPIDLTDGNTVTLTYSVMFQKGFDWVKGGKLPGLYGGEDDQIAVTCSGGRHAEACWSARMMWRTGGAMELYAYIPQTSQNAKALKSVPHTGENDTYGTSVGRGIFKFTAGEWATIGQRVTLNTPGKYDGSIEIYVNGKSLFVAHGLKLRQTSKGKVRGIQMQIFHGGHDPSWAPHKDQSAYFKDFSAAVYH